MSKKVKIQITSWLNGSVLFEYESVDNTIAKTLERAVRESADLRSADLSSADLRSANLRSADLRSANLRSADLSSADLRSADLSSALTLMGCVLRGCKLKNLPPQFINICSRDMLFIFNHLKKELPGLRKALIEGRVDGSQYEGECACLIGTLANLDGGLTEVCSAIPYYEKDAANPGETWFLAISEGDTPKNNEFSKHAVMLIDTILKPKKVKKTPKSNQKEQ